MKTSEIFHLQDRAALSNVRRFEGQFHWCEHTVELMLDTHVFLANDPEIVAHRGSMRYSDAGKFEAMNVIVNMAYDAVGSLISALRLMEYGVLADTWSLIRGAFESTCYAEFFALDIDKVKDYLQIAEKIKHNRSVHFANEFRNAALTVTRVLKVLQQHDGENRTRFYARLSTFGTHASPVRSGLRIKVDEPEVRVYLSIEHRELIQCLTDFAATAKYTQGIPFEAWPDLMRKNSLLFTRYRSLEEDYKVIFHPA